MFWTITVLFWDELKTKPLGEELHLLDTAWMRVEN